MSILNPKSNENEKTLPPKNVNKSEALLLSLKSLEINGEVKVYSGDDQIVLNKLNNQLSQNISQKEKARILRLIRLHNMDNLCHVKGHPIQQIVKKISDVPEYKGFFRIFSPEIVTIKETFDNFLFKEDHVARNMSDTYYIDGEQNDPESKILRPHISVMRNSFLSDKETKKILNEKGEVGTLSRGKVYRVDDVDPTHHQVFHQIDGLYLAKNDFKKIDKNTLKKVLKNNVHALFGSEVEYRIRDHSFPYTNDSMEIDVMYNGERLEILGSGLVKGEILEKMGIDPEEYSGRAFGMGVERIAMPIKQIPDIRIFWSKDERIASQRGNIFVPYEEVSKFPSTDRSISIITPTGYNRSEITEIMRECGNELIEEIQLISERDGNKNGEYKFGEGNSSITYKIIFRSIDRTLTKEEINKIYFTVREKIVTNLGLKLN